MKCSAASEENKVKKEKLVSGFSSVPRDDDGDRNGGNGTTTNYEANWKNNELKSRNIEYQQMPT